MVWERKGKGRARKCELSHLFTLHSKGEKENRMPRGRGARTVKRSRGLLEEGTKVAPRGSGRGRGARAIAAALVVLLLLVVVPVPAAKGGVGGCAAVVAVATAKGRGAMVPPLLLGGRAIALLRGVPAAAIAAPKAAHRGARGGGSCGLRVAGLRIGRRLGVGSGALGKGATLPSA